MVGTESMGDGSSGDGGGGCSCNGGGGEAQGCVAEPLLLLLLLWRRGEYVRARRAALHAQQERLREIDLLLQVWSTRGVAIATPDTLRFGPPHTAGAAGGAGAARTIAEADLLLQLWCTRA